MIDLSTFSTPELLQLHARVSEIELIARIGIVPPHNEIIAVVDENLLHSQLVILQNHILEVLHERSQ